MFEGQIRSHGREFTNLVMIGVTTDTFCVDFWRFLLPIAYNTSKAESTSVLVVFPGWLR